LVNELKICIAVIIQGSFYVAGFDDLLTLILNEFRNKYSNIILENKMVCKIDFDEN
jgi:hypothetical protein